MEYGHRSTDRASPGSRARASAAVPCTSAALARPRRPLLRPRLAVSRPPAHHAHFPVPPPSPAPPPPSHAAAGFACHCAGPRRPLPRLRRPPCASSALACPHRRPILLRRPSTAVLRPRLAVSRPRAHGAHFPVPPPSPAPPPPSHAAVGLAPPPSPPAPPTPPHAAAAPSHALATPPLSATPHPTDAVSNAALRPSDASPRPSDALWSPVPPFLRPVGRLAPRRAVVVSCRALSRGAMHSQHPALFAPRAPPRPAPPSTRPTAASHPLPPMSRPLRAPIRRLWAAWCRCRAARAINLYPAVFAPTVSARACTLSRTRPLRAHATPSFRCVTRPARRLTPCRAVPRTINFCHAPSTPPRPLRAPRGCLAPRPAIYTPGGAVSCTVARHGALSTPATPSSHTMGLSRGPLRRFRGPSRHLASRRIVSSSAAPLLRPALDPLLPISCSVARSLALQRALSRPCHSPLRPLRTPPPHLTPRGGAVAHVALCGAVFVHCLALFSRNPPNVVLPHHLLPLPPHPPTISLDHDMQLMLIAPLNAPLLSPHALSCPILPSAWHLPPSAWHLPPSAWHLPPSAWHLPPSACPLSSSRVAALFSHHVGCETACPVVSRPMPSTSRLAAHSLCPAMPFLCPMGLRVPRSAVCGSHRAVCAPTRHLRAARHCRRAACALDLHPAIFAPHPPSHQPSRHLGAAVFLAPSPSARRVAPHRRLRFHKLYTPYTRRTRCPRAVPTVRTLPPPFAVRPPSVPSTAVRTPSSARPPLPSTDLFATLRALSAALCPHLPSACPLRPPPPSTADRCPVRCPSPLSAALHRPPPPSAPCLPPCPSPSAVCRPLRTLCTPHAPFTRCMRPQPPSTRLPPASPRPVRALFGPYALSPRPPPPSAALRRPPPPSTALHAPAAALHVLYVSAVVLLAPPLAVCRPRSLYPALLAPARPRSPPLPPVRVSSAHANRLSIGRREAEAEATVYVQYSVTTPSGALPPPSHVPEAPFVPPPQPSRGPALPSRAISRPPPSSRTRRRPHTPCAALACPNAARSRLNSCLHAPRAALALR
ncbi:hypothetical protein DENSPDRAFT_934720 [Dentipellis sp. KUC8613]|nr:hypothetical protein DENSPDRAFT_934720 [Dentipellis sp. KUC8613]